MIFVIFIKVININKFNSNIIIFFNKKFLFIKNVIFIQNYLFNLNNNNQFYMNYKVYS